MRVLVSAYGCGPGRGSEPGVGWNWARQLARHFDVWVLSPESERAAIEDFLRSGPLPNLTFVFCDLPRSIRFRNDGPLLQYHLHLYLWQAAALFAARKLHAEVGFDVAHHITVGMHWRWSFLAFLPVPFLWGPVGGAEHAPRPFFRSFSTRGKMQAIQRFVIQKLGEFDPLMRCTARRAALTLAKTKQTAVRVSALGARRTRVMSEAGMPADEIERLAAMPLRQGGPLRLLSLGRLLHWKGFELGLRAFAAFVERFPGSEYWIVGDGPERSRLEKLAEELGVRGQVKFWGTLPRATVLERLADCDVLVHPSLHDSGGWVCLEGMAAGRPVVCLDLGGPGVQVTNETGIKIEATTPGQAVRDMADAFALLNGNRELQRRLGQAGRTRVQQYFAWERKAEVFVPLYDALAASGARADLAVH
ncbi:MAG TPA: glycosyltransferase [Bryobacteraceae bacterium]|nr:glycosyltransferase [Bryobacteraceae bacterium]